MVKVLSKELKDEVAKKAPAIKRGAQPHRTMRWLNKNNLNVQQEPRTMETIDDLPIEEGQALVWDLLRHAVQPSNAFLRPWERGDLLVWDQRRVFHGRVPYELRDDDPRLM